MSSSTISLTSTLDGVDGQRHSSGVNGTHCGPQDRSGRGTDKLASTGIRSADRRKRSRVAIPTELSPTYLSKSVLIDFDKIFVYGVFVQIKRVACPTHFILYDCQSVSPLCNFLLPRFFSEESDFEETL